MKMEMPGVTLRAFPFGAFSGIVQTGILLVSHPFRRKTRNGWGTEVYSKSENALDCGDLAREKAFAESRLGFYRVN
jgi:hypothetical protein